MSYPEVYHNTDLSAERLSRAKATYILSAVALRHSIKGSVSVLSRDLGFSDQALQSYVYRLRMPKRAWAVLSPLMTSDEREAFRNEVSVPNE